MAQHNQSPRIQRELRLLRPQHIDIEALELAFESHELEATWYFDLDTGEVELVSDRDAKLAIAADPERLDRLSDSRREAVARARRVLRQLATRFVAIPEDDPSDAWGDMAAWLDHVDDSAIRRRLRSVIRGKNAFREFRRILYEADRLDEFSAFAQTRLRVRIVEWLANLGLAAMFDD